MAVLIVLTLHIPGESSGRTLSQVSVALQAVVLVALSWFLSTYASASFRYWSIRCLGVDYGACLLAILFATVATVATLIQLSKSTIDKDDKLLRANENDFLVGLSVALGLAFAFQIGFLSVHFFIMRQSDQKALPLHTLEEDRQAHSFRFKSSVKSLRYSQTTPDPEPISRMMNSMDSRTPPSSIGGRSRAGTITSIKVQLSNAIRPVTSKTQLITGESRRPISMDSTPCRSSEDAFDTWDTSSVDTQNRQVVMEATTPPQQTKGHFLETIPGSPTASRTPSPNNEMPFEPPRIRARSRSYSPVPSRREQPSPQPSISELHIHPLFRSDSPTPPPIATPGTVVVASPNAGQVITHRQSLRSLNQMRVASTPVVPSPLSHRDSMDSRRLRDEQGSIREHREAETDSQTSSERPITPPIPEWVLGAGSRSSWTGYNSRKVTSDSDSEGETIGEQKN
ncbi:hypothetical protein FALBO_13207 [Fusarium albosuccineum]|uniref:MARVEL domain-containing protein n=1 Tax=Fusarium albosuccineum TaxID=1237068 RepID=A0A8H4P8F5_9HYPO|nr:hypothetical protein FALBO_13207 [Fusarium albosuccineum]